MRWWGLVALVLAACEGGGVEIIVYPPADPQAAAPDEVRLYVGIGFGADTHLASKNFPPDRDRSGELWTRDDDEPFDTATPASPTSPVRFTLAARHQGDVVSAVAVGLTHGVPTSAAALYELAVPTAHVAVYELGLNAAGEATPNSTQDNQVELWGPGQGDQTCVQLVDTRDDGDPDHPIAWVSSPNDADCDGFPNGDKAECDDHVYRAMQAPATSNLSCVETVPVMTPTTGQDVCEVGGPQCIDGDPDGHVACSHAVPYCAPHPVCAQCNDPDPEKAFDCAIAPDAPDPNEIAGGYACQVPFMRGVNDEIVLCPANYQIAYGYGLAPTITAGCTNPMFHGSAGSDHWTQQVQLAGGKYTLGAAQNGQVALCMLGLIQIMAPDDPSKLPVTGLLAVDLAPNLGLVQPIEFTLEPQARGECTATPIPITCHGDDVTGDLQLAECMKLAPGADTSD